MNLLDFLHQTVAQVSTMPAWLVVLSKATLLLTVAWLIHFALAKTNPRWRVLLWRGAAVGLLLLAAWTVGLPGYAVQVERPEPEPEAVAVLPPSVPQPPVDIVPERGAFLEDPPRWADFEEAPTMAPVEPIPVDVPTEAAPIVEAAKTPLPWLTILAVVWAVGVVLLVARTVVAYVRLMSLLRNAQAAPDGVVAEVERTAAALRCRSVVRVRRSERFAVPFLYGLRRPTLVLPERMCETSYGSQLPAILAHELAHTCSRDLAWNTVVQAVSIVLWFHPLMWRISRTHQAACDRVADAVSAAHVGDVQAYCQTLARVALELGSSPAPSVGLAMARHSDIRRRLALLQRRVFATPLKRRLVAGVGLVGLMVLGLLAGVRFVVAEAALTNDEQQPVAEQSGVRPMRIQVLDPEGNPIAGAGVTVRGSLPARFLSANAQGIAQIKVSAAETLRLSVLVWHDDHVTAGLRWPSGTPQESVPTEYTVTLQRGTVIGGVVHNEQGQPLADAKVTIRGFKSQPGEILEWSIDDRVRSDADGKWSSRRIPEDVEGFDATISVHHSSCVGWSVFEVAKLSINQLRARTVVMVVRNGITVEGRVTDAEGKPVAGALVGQFMGYLKVDSRYPFKFDSSYPFKFHSSYPGATTDQNGRYRLAGCVSGDCILAAAAEGHTPNARRVEVTEEQRTFDLQLRQGEPIRLRVVDRDGKPIAGADVTLAASLAALIARPKAATLDTAMQALEETRNPTTDAEGRWSRNWIPRDELEFYIRKDGYGIAVVSFAPDGREQVVTLKASGWVVAGRVVDRETKAPVTEFHVVEGMEYHSGPFWYGSRVSWRRSRPVRNEDGQYRLVVPIGSRDWHGIVRIEAEGYLPSDTPRLPPDGGPVTFDVELVPAEPVTGVVLSPDGKPLADAQVALYTASRRLFLKNGRPDPDRQWSEHLIVRTAADGRFSLTPPKEPYALMVMHDEGFARVENEEDMKAITIQPWARVEGTLRVGAKPVAGQFVELIPESSSGPGAPSVHAKCNATTDELGRFTFDRVVSGKGQIIRRVGTDIGSPSMGPPAHFASATFVAGETTQVELSRDGRPVIGQIRAPELRKGVSWPNLSGINLQMVPSSWEIPSPPSIPWPVDIDPEKDLDRAKAWWKTWKDSEQGKLYQKELARHQTIMQDRQAKIVYSRSERDGSFLFEDMPAGDYRLTARLYVRSSAGQSTVVYSAERELTIPEMPGGRSDEPLDLGELTLSLSED